MLATLRNYAELMRVANVFTAVSNVWMGMIFVADELPGWFAVGITATSVLLYLSGMVLNDVFDHRIDAEERPERPIPSGRVSLRSAAYLGFGLMAIAIAVAAATAINMTSQKPFLLAILLAWAILAYDTLLKKTWFGPMAMGLCRALNVLLGMSVAAMSDVTELFDFNTLRPIPAIAMGVYIVGVTWIARDEATEGNRRHMLLGTALVVAALSLIAAMPFFAADGLAALQLDSTAWLILWFFVAGTILRRVVVAWLQPTTRNVQRAVGNAILSIITIDASICLGYADPFWALSVLALIAPAMLLSQVFKVT